MAESDGFSVEADSLVAAAGGIRAIVDAIDRSWVGLLGNSAGACGYESMDAAVSEFAVRWITEIERIVGDQEGVADQLVATAEMFLDTDISVADAMRNDARGLDYDW